MSGGDRRDNEENRGHDTSREGVNVTQLEIITMVDFNDPHQGRSVYKQLINSLQGSLA